MLNYRTLTKNLSSLFISEIFNKGIVFITTAYLGRILQPEGFGIISLSNTFLIYFLLLVNLGFGTIGTREVAKNPQKIDLLVNTIISIKILLSFIAYGLLFLTVYFLDKDYNTKLVIWVVGLNIFAHAIMLDWLYQGIEKMEFIALRQSITSTMNLIGILIFVNNKDDVLIAVIISLISLLLNSIWMLLHYNKKIAKFRFTFDFKRFFEYAKPTLYVAIINVAVAVYTNINILLLGIFKTEEETGLYTAGFKILMLTNILAVIIQNSFYPQLSRAGSNEQKVEILNEYLKFMFFIGTIISAMFFTFSTELSLLIFGNEYVLTGDILRILSLQSFFSYFSIVLHSAFLAWGEEFRIMKIDIIVGVICVILSTVFIRYWGAIGGAFSYTISEFLLNVFLFFYACKLLRFKNYKNTLLFLLFAVISSLIAKYLETLALNFIISICLGFIIYSLLSIKFGSISLKNIYEQIKNAG